jgi:hypothetical protein
VRGRSSAVLLLLRAMLPSLARAGVPVVCVCECVCVCVCVCGTYLHVYMYQNGIDIRVPVVCVCVLCVCHIPTHVYVSNRYGYMIYTVAVCVRVCASICPHRHIQNTQNITTRLHTLHPQITHLHPQTTHTHPYAYIDTYKTHRNTQKHTHVFSHFTPTSNSLFDTHDLH